MGAILLSILVTVITAGVLWFHIVRPILESYELIAPRESVNPFQDVTSRINAQTTQTAQTDKQTDYVSEADLWLDRLEVDRTKTALIELLVYSGWEVGQIRGVIKGDNGAIGTEIEAAKKRLGMTEPPRQLRVKDDQGERLIPMQTSHTNQSTPRGF